MGYIIMSDLEKYKTWFYGFKKDNFSYSSDALNVIWNFSMAFMLGTFVALISWWAIHIFLPILNNIALILALLNGFLFFAPLFYQRSRFRF